MMAILSNPHTHTTYCDGKASAEEMVRAAIAKGFHCLGFSGHCYTAFDESYAMSKEGTLRYLEEIRKLQREYEGVIDILAGVEWDYYGEIGRHDFDFTIGSVHYIHSPLTGKYYTIDYTAEELECCLKEGFAGDMDAMLSAYFNSVADTAVSRKPTILGHFDLIRKLNRNSRFFDEESPAYLEIALSAVEKAVEAGAVIEVNTGGIYRGYCSTPYPAEPILRRIYSLGGEVIVTSDAHDTESIGFLFEQTQQQLKAIGFQQVQVLRKDGLRAQEI